MTNPFIPSGATKSLAVTDSTGRVALTGPGRSASVRIVNAGASTAFVKFGGSTVEAATTDMPILPGTVEIFDLPESATYMAGICASGLTATLYATTGQGV